jgi:hypothetical protein
MGCVRLAVLAVLLGCIRAPLESHTPEVAALSPMEQLGKTVFFD